ncbi:hypothetical protein [Brevundimonas sp.]|uniref:hypothetical protein n=1 Tax=Brevundimonas sp. TaxID=1871086 RepID=UPI003D6CFC69
MKGFQIAAWMATIAVCAPGSTVASGPFDPDELVRLADRYCLGPDGDHEWTWALATHDGFSPLSPDGFSGLRLPAARQLRGFEKTIDGAKVRILTANNRISGGGVGRSYFHLCWVSAEPTDRRSVDAALRSFLDVGRIRQEGAFAYLWIPQDDGTRGRVSRKSFNLRGHALAREEGMRMALTNNVGLMVAVTYMRAVDDCADWCY